MVNTFLKKDYGRYDKIAKGGFVARGDGWQSAERAVVERNGKLSSSVTLKRIRVHGAAMAMCGP